MTEREYWQPLIQIAGAQWNEIERLAVVEGIRPAAYQPVKPEDMLNMSVWATSRGLVSIPIAVINSATTYSAAGTATVDPAKPIEYRCVITRPENVATLQRIPNIANNDAALGEFLGYPSCCRDFFMQTWANNQVDTTWDQFATSNSAFGSVEANMLWRWIGIRWVSHLPCSYQCQHTIALGRQMRQLMKKYGYHESAHTIDTVLSWPVEWSGINGIAEIVGPCIKISTRTDWAPPRDNRRFSRKGIYQKPRKQMWTLNGFTSFTKMFTAHEPVVKAVSEFAPKDSTVVDLGCGTGVLLRRIMMHRPDIQLVGYDHNGTAINEARQIGIGTFHEALLKTYTGAPDHTVLLNPVRLTELPPDDAAALRAELAKAAVVIVYDYDDMIQKKRLNEWVAAAGLPVENLMIVHQAEDVQVGVIEHP